MFNLHNNFNLTQYLIIIHLTYLYHISHVVRVYDVLLGICDN